MATLESIQSGDVDFGSFDTSISVVVNVYNPAKTILLWHPDSLDVLPSDYNIMATKISDTVISFTRSSSTELATIKWVLLSFSDGVSIQNTQNTVDISAVDISKTFVICSGILTEPLDIPDHNCLKVIGPTDIGNTYMYDQYCLQVVEYDTCNTIQLDEGITLQQLVFSDCTASDDCKLCTWFDNNGIIKLQSLG
jgi:hypothetical protein